MNSNILELAIEALQHRKTQIDKEIEELRAELSGVRPKAASSGMTQSEKMKAYWAARRAAAGKTASTKAKADAKPRRRQKTAAEKKAISEKLKAAWAKRKAGKAS